MVSIFENTSHPVTVHIFHDDTLTDDNRQKFLRTAEKYSQQVNLIDVSFYRDKIKKSIGAFLKFPIGTTYRSFIPDVLNNLEKVIYLDCDIVVNMDIYELWKIDLQNNSLAGVIDCQFYLERDLLECFHVWFHLIGISLDKYINSGVLLMDLERVRKKLNMSYEFQKFIIRYRNLTRFVDQDAINMLFKDDIKIIDARFNEYRLDKVDIAPENCIIHAWASKPFKKIAGHVSDRLYWKYYLKSAWGEHDTPEDLIKKICDIAAGIPEPTKQKKSIFKSSIFYKTMRKASKKCSIEFRKIIALCVKNIIYKLQYKSALKRLGS